MRMTEAKTLPAGSSWREELDRQRAVPIKLAEEWLVKGPPSRLSSKERLCLCFAVRVYMCVHVSM